MTQGAFTAYFDVAQLVLYMFWIFFAGLCWWLARENRREGYPLESDVGTHTGWMELPAPKTYRLPDGREVAFPNSDGATPADNVTALRGHGGTAFEPVGDPMLAGVGPGTWVARHDEPELDLEGNPKIRPLSMVAGYEVSRFDPDPRGMTVFDARGEAAGVVSDLWLDVPECQFRYMTIQVPLAAGGKRDAILPIPFARITRNGVKVHALLASQFADVPAIKSPDVLTSLEEERIAAYYGGGLLYAEPKRAEPLI